MVVLTKDFLSVLAKCVKRNKTAYENYFWIFVPEGFPVKSESTEPTRVNILFRHIQIMLSSETVVIPRAMMVTVIVRLN